MRKILLSLLFFLIPISSHADILTGLVGWWAFDDGSGTNATDGSGNSNTAALQNTPPWVSGKIGPYALNFNGTSQYAIITQSSSINGLGPLTISFWIKPIQLGAGIGIISKDDGNSVNGDWWVAVGTDPSTVGDLEFAKEASNANLRYGVIVPPLNVWTNVIITWDGGTAASGVHIYFNTVEKTELGHADQVGGGTTTQDLWIGTGRGNTNGGSSGTYYNGALDEVRLYNRVLTSADITQLYNYGLWSISNIYSAKIYKAKVY